MLKVLVDLFGRWEFQHKFPYASSVGNQKNKKGWEETPFQLWSRLAPPKVKLLVWRVYGVSLPSKVNLFKRRVIRREEDLVCVFCRSVQETSDHLMLHCPWSRKLWVMSINWWGASWVMPETARNLLESWALLSTSKSYKRVWRTLGYAIVWSIWEERNNRCFQSKTRRVEDVGELVKIRLAWWEKYRSSKCLYSSSIISRIIEVLRESF
ncbi:hypothetical protein QQ045_021323 [Rhodiola kirilowii]